MKKEERQQEAKNLVQRYPFLKETESYIQLEETFHLLGNTEESTGKEAQENTEQGKEVQENTEQENIAQENPAPESASQEETTPAENGCLLYTSGIDFEARCTEYAGQAEEFAAEMTADGEEHLIVALGGDGTVNEVINGILDCSKVVFGYIPTGSGNDFTRALKIPTLSLIHI